MYNYAKATSLQGARDRKALYKIVLNLLVDGFVLRHRPAPLAATVATAAGAFETWLLAGSVGCGCGGEASVYRCESGREATLYFCPECWVLEARDNRDQAVGRATRALEKTLRELPPGTTLTAIGLGDREIKFDHPIPNPFDSAARATAGSQVGCDAFCEIPGPLDPAAGATPASQDDQEMWSDLSNPSDPPRRAADLPPAECYMLMDFPNPFGSAAGATPPGPAEER